MEPRHLVQLAVILDKGSITAATQSLNITQPTLTRNMQTLEMEAGGPLFTRSRFGVRSTALGELLARDGRAVTKSIESARESAARYRQGLKAEIRLGVGPILSLALMPLWTSLLLNPEGSTAMTIRCDSPRHVLDALVDGELDVVLAPAVRAAPMSGTVRETLVKDFVGVFCGHRHPLAGRRKIRAAGLSGQNWLGLGISTQFELDTPAQLTAAGMRSMHTQLATSGDAAMLLNLLSMGRHLALLPKFPARQLSEQYNLVELPVSDLKSPRNIYFWCREALAGQESFERFKQTVRAHVSALHAN